MLTLQQQQKIKQLLNFPLLHCHKWMMVSFRCGNPKAQAPKKRSNLELIPLFFLIIVVSLPKLAESNGFRCGTGNHLACIPRNYSKFDLPIKKGVNRITVSIDIAEVLRINDKDYSITFSGYFIAKWQDRRIRLGPDFGEEQAGLGINITENPNIAVPVNTEFIKDIWMPDIFIYSLKTYKVMDVLNKLAGLWVGADKTILYSQATHITFICPMRFDKFPLDKQVCKFQVGSCSYDDTKMQFMTESAGYQSHKTANSIALDYDIAIKLLSKEDQVFFDGGLGNFSLAGFELVLHRYVSTYIITYYLPSGLFVIVSWISFLIPMDVIPGRMGLLVMLFLVLVNIFNTVTTNTPKAEGLTAIEAWMLACILFVFGALIEYAAILFKKQRYVSAQNKLNIRIVWKDNLKYEVYEQRPPPSTLSLQHLAEEYWRIDKFFLISFPILFFIFNIIYWLSFVM
ncbi:glycine receptor subunit alphaZ1 [Lepeophtheirus salmonis]|uniref:Gammaaminobutyric acid receptor subunit deltalike [Bombyx mori] n=1 Tax=Lepeophtheirus salmonis TaxID=72036 RepID=A0A0K2SZ30_LEPSM|nr:glycine receptor subunit alphaZ1-like [Lepeophtheirus salmonis]